MPLMVKSQRADQRGSFSLVEPCSLDGIRDDNPGVLGNRAIVVRIGVLDRHEQRTERLDIGEVPCFPRAGVLVEVVGDIPERSHHDLPVLPRLRENVWRVSFMPMAATLPTHHRLSG